MVDHKNLTSDIRQVAELPRGDFKQSEFRLVILPFTVLRRIGSVLEPIRAAVLAKLEEIADKGDGTERLPTCGFRERPRGSFPWSTLLRDIARRIAPTLPCCPCCAKARQPGWVLCLDAVEAHRRQPEGDA